MSSRNFIIYGLAVLALLAVPLQGIIDPSLENLACACLVLASSLALLIYIGCTDALKTQPLSTFSIFGFCVTTQLSALLLQTALWTPLRSSLYDGMYTFGTLAFYQAIALAVHAGYCFFSNPRPQGVHVFRGVFAWAGIYVTPCCGALWAMGFIGLVSFAVYASESILESPIGKIVQAINFLAWAPFLIPFYLLEFGKNYCNWPLNRMLLLVYSVVLLGLGVVLNTRGVMLLCVVTVGLLYLLAGMRSERRLTGRSFVRIGAVVGIALVLGAPLADLSSAMAIARRLGKAPMMTKVERTLDVWRQPQLIAAYRAEQAEALLRRSYDEHYVDNPIAARFVLTKYVDNSLHFGGLIVTDEAQANLRDVSVKFLWATLPAPILSALGVSVDKDQLDFSMGDYLSYLTHGDRLGGHRMGVMFGQGIALFGPLLPFLFAFMCLVLYGLMDLLTIKHTNGISTISALGMLQIWRYFNGGLLYEGLHSVFEFVVRNYWQITIMYIVVERAVQLVLPSKSHTPEVSNAPGLSVSL